jgi:hypothetical protein
MDWIDHLEKDAFNFVIDELVWHLREGRIPVAIRKNFSPKTGVEFCFESERPSFLAVEQILFEEHWDEALSIIGRFPELRALKTIDP